LGPIIKGKESAIDNPWLRVQFSSDSALNDRRRAGPIALPLRRGWLPVNKLRFLMAKHLSFFIIIGAVIVAVSACVNRLDTRGNLLDPERVEEIKPGEQTREEVAEILGSPSSIDQVFQGRQGYRSR
jgi:hypothetical protein